MATKKNTDHAPPPRLWLQLLEADDLAPKPGELTGHFSLGDLHGELTTEELKAFRPLIEKLKARAAAKT